MTTFTYISPKVDTLKSQSLTYVSMQPDPDLVKYVQYQKSFYQTLISHQYSSRSHCEWGIYI